MPSRGKAISGECSTPDEDGRRRRECSERVERSPISASTERAA
jgi:hypothetical protein